MLGTLTAMGSFALEARAVCNPADPSQEVPSAAVVVLLDRSGSMAGDGRCQNGDVTRKWECAVNDARTWIDNNDPFKERVYFIWQFRTMGDPTIMTVEDNGVLDRGYCVDEAVTKLNPVGPLIGPVVDDAATPLAGAYCEAVKFLVQYRMTRNLPDLPLHIKLMSDGLENRTPDTHECFGEDGGSDTFTPSSPETGVVFDPPPPGAPLTVDGLLLGSWQAQMYDAAITGVAHPYDPPAFPLNPAAFQYVAAFPTPLSVITNVAFIDDFIPTVPLLAAGPSAFVVRSGVDRPAVTGGGVSAFALAATVPSSFDDLVHFFGNVAEMSGGRLQRYGSGIPAAPGDPHGIHAIPADADDSSCVDAADFQILDQAFGQRVTIANPSAAPADLTGDGAVDALDYLLLREHFGEGCATDPGPVPVLADALFGFENPADWSSPQTPLAATALGRTEGAFSLKLAGTGWREITSRAFATSLFQGVSPRIAFDIRLPANPTNRFWLGQTLLFVNAPSAGIHNQYLGAFELTGRPLGAFSTATFNVPANVRAAMATPRSDFTIKIVVNANDADYQLDNLRFVP